MDPLIIPIIAIQVVFIVLMTKIILDYRRAKADREASAMSLTTSELKQIIQEALEETTTPLQQRLDDNERLLALMEQRLEGRSARLLEAGLAEEDTTEDRPDRARAKERY